MSAQEDHLTEDHLDEDKPFKFMVKKQLYCIVSMLTPNAFPEDRRADFKDQKIMGLKVRGVFESYEDAKTQCDKFQKLDKFHNIFIGEVGKWLPFDVDISNMLTDDDPVYREKALNQYMKAYKDCLKEEDVTEKERKDEKTRGANIVTGKTDAPMSTGIGCPEITPPGVIPPSMIASLNQESTLKEHPNKVDECISVGGSDKEEILNEQINVTTKNKVRLEEDLEASKKTLKALEDKISTISQLYAELKK